MMVFQFIGLLGVNLVAVILAVAIVEWWSRGFRLPSRPVFLGGIDREKEAEADRAQFMRDCALEEQAAAAGRGHWVKIKDMHPACNVANRIYRTPEGDIRRAYSFPLYGEAEAWFFPDPDAMNQRAMH